MKKSKRVNTLEKFIYSAQGREAASRVFLLSDGCGEGPFELPLVSMAPFSSWFVAGALSFMVFMGLNAGQADALPRQAEPNQEKGVRPVHHLPGYIGDTALSEDCPAVVNTNDGLKSVSEFLPARVNLVTTATEEIDRLFAHTNVQPHTNVTYTDIPWSNWTNIVTHTNNWANHQNSFQPHMNIDPGTPGGGGGIIY